ncbi:MAG: hypothetical protein JJU02_02170 [Cryomorphaceae bacterium]|nr:hypothetical protein [Cryomorphaceae bacterium]
MKVILNNLNVNTELQDGVPTTEARFLAIKNPDGSIRWIWPAGANKPTFLRFYNIDGFRAGLFAFLIRLIFALRLQRLVFAKFVFTLPKNQEGAFVDPFSSNWSLFTGTTGPNQKYVLYKANAIPSFAKISISEKSTGLINREVENLSILDQLSIRTFTYPKVLATGNHGAELSTSNDHTLRHKALMVEHVQAIDEMATKSAREMTGQEFAELHQIPQRLEALKNRNFKIPAGIIKKLELLTESIKTNRIITHFAHGDFTPWNMYVGKNRSLFVYDWELASDNYPKAFDFFHFGIQKGVLMEHKGWKEIYAELKSFQNQALFYEESMDELLRGYLLLNTLNYLEVYNLQTNWHVQVQWLLDVWNEALSYVLQKNEDVRGLVILDLFDHLDKKPYAGLKLSNNAPEKLSAYSDLDMCIHRDDAKKTIAYLRNHPLVDHIKVVSKRSMTNLFVITQDNGLLSVDFIHQLKRKQTVYMDIQTIIDHAERDLNRVKKASLLDTARFIGLFYGLNGQQVPAKYMPFELLMSKSEQKTDDLIYGVYVGDTSALKSLKVYMLKKSFNMGWAKIKNTITYIWDTLIQMFSQKGMIITFSGVDGAGKSTIIEHTKIEIEKKLRRRVVVIRHRPSLLPILKAMVVGKAQAEKQAADTLPRQGNNRNVLSSLLRFGYYYLDYLVGQFVIYFKHVLRGHVVLYDRYYFDFINDSVRSNIRLPKWFLRAGYALLMQPNLNFFLYADPQVILKRKQELDEVTITRLTHDYLNLFGKLSRRNRGQYIPVENIELKLTMQLISNNITQKLI